MAIGNIESLSAQLARMTPQQRQSFAAMHKDDPILVSLAKFINDTEQAKAQALQQGQQGQQPPPPKVVDTVVASLNPQPQQPQQMLPEQQGIGALPAPNMQQMADGGIAGYPEESEFDFVQRSEPVVRMAGGGTPDREKFFQTYRPIAEQTGRELGVDPDMLLAQWALETAWGTKTVGQYNLGNIKDFTGKGPRALDKAEGSRDAYKSYESPEEFGADYASLIKRNFPKAAGAGADVGAFTEGLLTGKTGKYATDPAYAIKVGRVYEDIKKSGAPAAPRAEIPGQAPGVTAPAAVTQEEGMFGRLGTKMGLSEDTKRNLGHTFTALGGAMGPAYIPSYLPKATSGIAALGERIHGMFSPQKGVMSAQEIAQAQKFSDTARTAEAVESARRTGQNAGATLEETQALMELARKTQAGDRAARAAQTGSAAEKVQAASVAREAADAARITQAARATQGAGQVAGLTMTSGAPALPPLATTPRIDPSDYSNEGRNYPKPIKRDEVKPPSVADIKKDASPEVKKQAKQEGWTNDDWLTFGFALLSSKSPYFSQALGEAGLGALAGQKARRKQEAELAKEESESLYRKALADQAMRGPGDIAMVERIAKEKNISFSDALEYLSGVKRAPQTEEMLMKEWGNNFMLRQQYPKPEDYIKLMMTAQRAGTPQFSAADRALVSKYTNP